MTRITIGFRPGSLLPRLEERVRAGDTGDSTTLVSKRYLERLFAVLPLELGAARENLNLPTAELLLALYHDAWPMGIEPTLIPLLPSAVEAELQQRPQLRDQAPPLVQNLGRLTAGQRLAVVDAIERALRLVEHGAAPPDALRQVGLIS